MGATALESLAGFALTCECSHLSSLVSDLCVSCSLCLFSTFMGLPPLVLASLRCFAFLRACSPFFISGVSGFDLPPRHLGVMTKPTANCSIELKHLVARFVFCLLFKLQKHPICFHLLLNYKSALSRRWSQTGSSSLEACFTYQMRFNDTFLQACSNAIIIS